MRLADAIIYLAEPVFGHKVLTGPVSVMTTWLDYTFNETIELPAPDRSGKPVLAEPVRVLIPLSNVLAVVPEKETFNDNL